MSKTPFDIMLDKADWQELPRPIVQAELESELEGGVPFATHQGTITVADKTLRVFQLSNGQRIIEANDMAAFFGFNSVEEFQQVTARLANLVKKGTTDAPKT